MPGSKRVILCVCVCGQKYTNSDCVIKSDEIAIQSYIYSYSNNDLGNECIPNNRNRLTSSNIFSITVEKRFMLNKCIKELGSFLRSVLRNNKFHGIEMETNICLFSGIVRASNNMKEDERWPPDSLLNELLVDSTDKRAQLNKKNNNIIANIINWIAAALLCTVLKYIIYNILSDVLST